MVQTPVSEQEIAERMQEAEPIIRYMAKRYAHRNDREDVVQQSRIRIWNRLRNRSDTPRMARFTAGICRYAILSYYKERGKYKRNVRMPVAEDFQLDGIVSREDTTAGVSLEDQQVLAVVVARLHQQFGQTQVEIFTDAINGIRQKDICKARGLSKCYVNRVVNDLARYAAQVVRRYDSKEGNQAMVCSLPRRGGV